MSAQGSRRDHQPSWRALSRRRGIRHVAGDDRSSCCPGQWPAVVFWVPALAPVLLMGPDTLCPALGARTMPARPQRARSPPNWPSSTRRARPPQDPRSCLVACSCYPSNPAHDLWPPTAELSSARARQSINGVRQDPSRRHSSPAHASLPSGHAKSPQSSLMPPL